MAEGSAVSLAKPNQRRIGAGIRFLGATGCPGEREINCISKGVCRQSVLEQSPLMPPPINYNFEKRKRENAKKAAKEAKKLRKEAAKASAAASGEPEPAEESAESAD